MNAKKILLFQCTAKPHTHIITDLTAGRHSRYADINQNFTS